jgi:O-antigen/teichoic acid export membrane protein
MTALREKATKGIFWSFIEQFATQGLSFTIGIILARILTPADYGTIGMISIFIAVANTFINGGFGNALVQKTDRNAVDYSTVFYFNLVVAVFFYLTLFFTAPYIAAFYKITILEPVIRILSLNFVISSFTIVPHTILYINIDFKTQTKISIISLIIAGIVGITMAYNNFGVWSLVTQSVISTVSQSILLIIFIRWKPLFVFSSNSFRQLFGFGSKLLASSILDTIYNNIYSLVIGKRFSAADLGQYSRAQQLQNFPSSNITSILQRVTFPIFCSIKDENERLIEAYRKLIRMTAFVVFPLMFMLVLIAKPLIIILLTDKWLPAVGLFQILCFAGIWSPIHILNLNILQTKGRSDLFLKLEFWKKVIGIIILIITIPFGLKAIVSGHVISSIIALFINTRFTGKHYGYGITQQWKDIYLFLLLAIGLCASLYYLIGMIDSNWVQLSFGVAVYGIAYFIISKILKFEELNLIQAVVKNAVGKSI